MYVFLLIVQLLIAVILIGLILLQQGKGAQTGAAFGSGASQTVFGSQGSGGFLSRATGVLVALFFGVNLLLVYIITQANHPKTVETPPVMEKKINPPSEPTNSDVPDV